MSLNKKFGTHVKESMAFQALEKTNSIAYLEVKLLAENLLTGVKNWVLSKSWRSPNSKMWEHIH